ncbi:hypothetical protein EWH21_23605 [Pseudomonas sp. REST10]|nr:MAG: hypothetical protein EP327_02770 [Pseudomonadales bacterium]WFC64826.1 hypothetical protein EWH21_23605 [Pseudomonas sp. REST10]HIQ44060.1 hypothetical protein [Pseudomonas oleovorans]
MRRSNQSSSLCGNSFLMPLLVICQMVGLLRRRRMLTR